MSSRAGRLFSLIFSSLKNSKASKSDRSPLERQQLNNYKRIVKTTTTTTTIIIVIMVNDQ